ncbi:MAG: lactate utilization protein C [Thermomicrobiales bacterium]
MQYLSAMRASERQVSLEETLRRIELFGERVAPLGVVVHRVETAVEARSAIRELTEAIGAEMARISAELAAAYESAFLDTAGGDLCFQIAVDPQASRDALVGITLATGAIAETGSVMLSEPDLANRSVGLLSLNLVVIVPTRLLHESLDDVTSYLRAQAKRPGGAYTTLLTGPSRTADIEMSLTVGVQGPGRVVVVFVDEEPRNEPLAQ